MSPARSLRPTEDNDEGESDAFSVSSSSAEGDEEWMEDSDKDLDAFFGLSAGSEETRRSFRADILKAATPDQIAAACAQGKAIRAKRVNKGKRHRASGGGGHGRRPRASGGGPRHADGAGCPARGPTASAPALRTIGRCSAEGGC